MQRTIVYRFSGDKEMGNSIANVLANPELQRLRAQIEISKPTRSEYYRKKIEEADRKYAIKPCPVWKQRLWGILGLLVLVCSEWKPRHNT